MNKDFINPKKPKFYGRQHGRKLRKTRTRLVEDFLPKISINLPEDENEKIDLSSLFSFNPKEIWLEVGFGGGEHLAGQAKKNPDIGIIGSEVFINGVASLLAHITGYHENGTLPEEQEISVTDDRTDNIRIYNKDVRQLFPHLDDGCLDKIFVLFPDPWPKSKHKERRFIGPDNLPQLARLLKKGGVLRVATDHKTYKSWALRCLSKDPNFKWKAKCSDDWRKEPSDWIRTRYQEKAIKEGRKAIWLDFEKI